MTWGEPKYVNKNSAAAPVARTVTPRPFHPTCRNPGIVAPSAAIARLTTIRRITTRLGSAIGSLRITSTPTSPTMPLATPAVVIFSHKLAVYVGAPVSVPGDEGDFGADACASAARRFGQLVRLCPFSPQ